MITLLLKVYETHNQNVHTLCHCVAYRWSYSKNERVSFQLGTPETPPKGLLGVPRLCIDFIHSALNDKCKTSSIISAHCTFYTLRL